MVNIQIEVKYWKLSIYSFGIDIIFKKLDKVCSKLTKVLNSNSDIYKIHD